MQPAVQPWPLKNHFGVGAVIMMLTNHNSTPEASNIVMKTDQKSAFKCMIVHPVVSLLSNPKRAKDRPAEVGVNLASQQQEIYPKSLFVKSVILPFVSTDCAQETRWA